MKMVLLGVKHFLGTHGIARPIFLIHIWQIKTTYITLWWVVLNHLKFFHCLQALEPSLFLICPHCI